MHDPRARLIFSQKQASHACDGPHPTPFDRRYPMFAKKLTAALIVASAGLVGFSVPAHAQEGTQDDFMILFKMTAMDKNKDGMVSKKELISMIEKAYDMKAKQMGAKGGQMTVAQMQEFVKSLSLYVGG
jgi:hypothetical protein